MTLQASSRNGECYSWALGCIMTLKEETKKMNKKRNINIRVSATMYDQLVALATKWDHGISTTARILLARDLKYWTMKENIKVIGRKIYDDPETSDIDIDDLIDQFEKSKVERSIDRARERKKYIKKEKLAADKAKNKK
jgi:hypothetical protein